MTVPYTPPAEFADLSPEAWARYVATVDGRARRVFQALADGERPLRAGEVAQLRTLTAGLRSAYGLTLNEAQAAAWQMGALTPRLAATLGSTLDAVPGHVTQAVTGMNGWLAAQGFQTVGLPAPTLAFLVNRTQQAITSDWTRLAVDLQDRIVTGLQYAVTAGQSIPDTVRVLRVGFADTAGWTAARATNVARTEIADVMHATARESMQTAGAEAWMWDATEDSRTCEICLTMHGRVFPMSEPMDSHQMCRCAQVPVFGDELDRLTGDPVGGDLGYMGGTDRLDGGVDRARLVKTDNPGWRPSWKVARVA